MTYSVKPMNRDGDSKFLAHFMGVIEVYNQSQARRRSFRKLGFVKFRRFSSSFQACHMRVHHIYQIYQSIDVHINMISLAAAATLVGIRNLAKQKLVVRAS